MSDVMFYFNVFGLLTMHWNSRAVKLNEFGGLFKLPTLVDPIFVGTHGPHDRDRKIVGKFLVARLCM